MAFSGIMGFTPGSGGLAHAMVTRIAWSATIIMMHMSPWFLHHFGERKGSGFGIKRLHYFFDS